MTKIKFPTWLPINDIKRIITILGNAKIVGGCVRDILLKRKLSDFDLATPLLPEEVLSKMQKQKVKCIPTGLKHGTVTSVLNGHHYEITTLRKDIKTFGRRAEVEYVSSWQEDSERRDFTINAMYLGLDGTLYDFHNGRNDLKTKLVKFVGSPEKRIVEDYLRVLRYFRFIAYFGVKHLDLPSYKACVKLASGLKQISAERIWMEMTKILKSAHINDALKLMHKASVLKVIGFKKFSPKALKLKYADDPIVNLAVLIKLAKLDPTPITTHWKLPNKDATLVKFLQNSPQPTCKWVEHEKNIYRYGKHDYLFSLKFNQILSGKDMPKQLIARINACEVRTLPINGESFLKLGYNGKVVGALLNKARNIWLDSNFKISSNDLIKKVIYDKPTKLKQPR